MPHTFMEKHGIVNYLTGPGFKAAQPKVQISGRPLHLDG